jgi:hypothetical protein
VHFFIEKLRAGSSLKDGFEDIEFARYLLAVKEINSKTIVRV